MIYIRIYIIVFILLSYGRVSAQSTPKTGINTTSPTNTLHIKGNTGEHPLRVEGLQTKGSESEVLYVDNNGVMKKGLVKGSLYAKYFVKSSGPSITVDSDPPEDIPNVSVTHTVPSTVSSQTLAISVNGYGVSNSTSAYVQGAFELMQDNVKIASSSGVSGSRIPVSITMFKLVTLTPGTYTFKVRFNYWSGSVGMIVNSSPSDDPEAQRTNMMILVYND